MCKNYLSLSSPCTTTFNHHVSFVYAKFEKTREEVFVLDNRMRNTMEIIF